MGQRGKFILLADDPNSALVDFKFSFQVKPDARFFVNVSGLAMTKEIPLDRLFLAVLGYPQTKTSANQTRISERVAVNSNLRLGGDPGS